MSSTYNTKQKQLILEFLSKNSEGHYTCDEIGEMLKQNGTPVGKSTVYRYLIKLQSEGKVRKFSDNGKSASFSYVENTEECSGHMHLKCLCCGEFVHLECNLMNNVSNHLKNDHQFKIDNTKTVLYGICGKCSGEKG